MIKWAYVEDGEVKELLATLPNNWRNISNFYTLDSDEEALNNLSWYRVVDARPVLNSNQQYTNQTYNIDLENKHVIINADVIGIPIDYLFIRNNALQQIREQRNNILRDCDWTQLADIREVNTPEWCKAWVDYRQRLRDLPGIYEALPIEEAIDLSQVDYYSGRP